MLYCFHCKEFHFLVDSDKTYGLKSISFTGLIKTSYCKTDNILRDTKNIYI